ncbi:MAG: BMP family ABC transporter substrate-binding protein [Candidatus Wallbacteria bacterium]|nr:BMP family ABC transporter substrate-binding protein [Candidatus Wallbacteria bacterium]
MIKSCIVFLVLSMITLADAAGFKVGLVTDIKGLGDRSFNDSSMEGITRAEKIFNFKASVLVPQTTGEIGEDLLRLAIGKCDLIVAAGYSMHDAVLKAAEQYPEIRFAIVDSVVNLPNVCSIVFREEEGAYLAGMAAAYVSKTGKIGFVGGMDVPLIDKFRLGYSQGAFAVNPAVKILSGYTGSYGEPVKGKEEAVRLYKGGADVIFSAAGLSGLGVISAAEESKFYAIGVDRDQDDLAPGSVLTSMVKRVDEAVYQVVKETYGGNFTPGVRRYGLREGGVGLTDFKFTKNNLPADLFIRLEQAKRDIISGRIKVNAVKR